MPTNPYKIENLLDVKTNKIVWQKNWDTVAYSGVLTTKGKLGFVG